MSVQPHSPAAERAVIGAVLLSERALHSVVLDDGLRPADFYSERYRLVFDAMCALYEAGEPVDRITVTARLKARRLLEDAGGEATLDDLGGPITAAGNVRSYAKEIRNHAILRALLRTTADIQQDVHTSTDPPDELLARAEAAMLAIGDQRGGKQARLAGQVMAEETERIYQAVASGVQVTGVPSGFKGLDELTGGFQPEHLIIIASRPAMGKSAFGVNIAEHAAVSGYGVALFTMEMSEAEVAQRLIASEAHVAGTKLQRAQVEDRHWPRIMEANNRMQAAKLWIDDTTDLSITELRAKARRIHKRAPLGLVVVDYLQLLRGTPGESRVQVVGEMSRGLKILASELKVPVIALAQLSRSLESRGTSPESKKPQLSDLRESGQIEQDANVVAFLFREEYYDPQTDRVGMADVLVKKHRGGPIGDVELIFDAPTLRFRNP